MASEVDLLRRRAPMPADFQGPPVASPVAAPAPQAAQVVAPPAVPARVTPQMPNFVGPPREVNRMKNEWMQDQAKAVAAEARDAAKAGAKAAEKNAKIGINLAGGRESVFINRVVGAGNQAAADLENVVKLPISASRGFFGGRQQGKSLFEAGKETLATAMTTQEVQDYNVFSTGFQRSLAAIEGMGLAPTNALMHMMDGVIFKEGDTHFTKLGKLAQTRQIVEKGMETIIANSRVDDETKRLAKAIEASVKRSVPFTPSDLIKLRNAQATNPNATLADVMGGLKNGPAVGSVQDGYRFKGGNPADKGSWEKVQ